MSEREAFGANLRRLRVQRGRTLEQIAEATKVGVELWAGLEDSELSRWPTGIYARAYVRAYALEIGADPDATVDEFCRLFPNGDRRAERVVRDQAALLGHDLRWSDDLVGLVTEERRARTTSAPDAPQMAITRTGRLVTAALDVTAVAVAAAVVMALLPIRGAAALALTALSYHAVSMVALGGTPAVWAVETYLASRHPSAVRTGTPRFLRLVRGSDRLKA